MMLADWNLGVDLLHDALKMIISSTDEDGWWCSLGCHHRSVCISSRSDEMDKTARENR